MMSLRRIGAASALILSAFLLLVTTNLSTLEAQSPGSVELVAQSAWVDDGGLFNIQVRIAGASPESTITLRIFTPWDERDEFLSQEVPDDAAVLLELEPVLLSDAQETSNEVISFEVLLDGPITRLTETPSDGLSQGAAVLESSGGSAIYPLEISLFDRDGELTDSFLSSLIELPRRDLRPPLDVSTVIEAAVDISPTPNETPVLDDEAVAELAILGDALSQHPTANIALSISPIALTALAEDESETARETIDELSSSLTSAQLFPNPIIDIEEQAWFDAELTDELLELYEAGNDAAFDAIGVRPQTTVMLLDRTIDATGIARLDELGVQGAIARPQQLTPLDRELFPNPLTTRFFIDGEDSEALPAIVTDNALSTHFTDEGSNALNANRLLADLVLLSLQNDGGRQSVVVSPPTDWRPDSRFLNVFLSGIERIPALRGASPEQALADTEITPSLGLGSISGPLQRRISPPVEAQSLRSFRTEYSQARNAIESWATVIGNENSSRRRLDNLLHLSAGQQQAGQEQNEFIEAVYSSINSEKDSAITTPEAETITLTGRESLVPIIVENNLSSPATVLMILSSGELDFQEGSEILQTLEPGPNRIEIPIIARASGDSPIRIQVLSPDRLVLLGSAEVLVRTFAFSGVGIAIGAIAIIVLFFWWLRHVRGARATVDPLLDEDTSEANEMIGV